MAVKVHPEDYPQVKYRMVGRFGPQVFYSWESVLKKLEYYRTEPAFKDDPKYQPKYIIKITEEYIEIPQDNTNEQN